MTQLLTSPRTKRAANVLGIVLLIALVAPFAAYAAPEVVGADESFVVLTASMTPAIAPGDVVIVAERDPAAIAEGDVITFVRGTSDVPVTHRVIGVVDQGGALAFETMGDANEGPDPGLVPAGNLVGAVTLTIPWIGYVIRFAGTRAGFVTLVLLPFGLLAVTEVWSIVRDRDGSEAPAPTAAASETASTGAPEPEATPDADAPTAAAASEGISVDAVGGAAAVLAAFAPYAVYVALELRTAAAIAVAVGASTLLLGALAAWVPASGVLDRGGSPGDPAAGEAAVDEGAVDEETSEAGQSEDRPPEPDWEAPDVTERAESDADDRPAVAGSSEAGDAPDPTEAIDGTGATPPAATLTPAHSDGAEEGS